MKTRCLYVDQYGNRFYVGTVKELRQQINNGGSRISKMYVGRKGKVYHVGYVVGNHWLTKYVPYEMEQK